MNLTVGELKDYIQSLPDEYEGIGIDSVDSWRGSYNEPAFTFGESSKSKMLSIISECLSCEFDGYKGGTYSYDIYSPVNFDTYGNYTDGGYFYGVIHDNFNSDFIIGLLRAMSK